MKKNLLILVALQVVFALVSWWVAREMFILGWLFLNFLLTAWVARPCREQTIERITHLQDQTKDNLKQAHELIQRIKEQQDMRWYLHKSPMHVLALLPPPKTIRQALEEKIEEIDRRALRGSGCIVELAEARRIEAICDLLDEYPEKDQALILELAGICRQDLPRDSNATGWSCEEPGCGESLTASELARSLSFSGEPRCTSHLAKAI
ncbi:hypothetical protein [Geoalkalibacter halelectricus]|uniref:hypothetical protein n=1 Tax=Geoalkalibacter halelectricus TaxID=2847045 RepID=UPI003D257C5F